MTAVVADDGAGGAQPGPGGGLAGLAERVAALGGTLRVDSPAGAGTRLEASIPLAPWGPARELVLDFGHEGDGGRGEQLIQKILDGAKTVSVSLAREVDLEGGPPRIGQRVAGRRRRRAPGGRPSRSRASPSCRSPRSATTRSPPRPRASARRRPGAPPSARSTTACREEIALAVGEPGWRLTDTEPMVVIGFSLLPAGAPQKK